MQKKIVAAICAAALALAMPVAAFADLAKVNVSAGTASMADCKSGNVKLTDIQLTGASDVYYLEIVGDGATSVAVSNAIPNSAASFTVTAKDVKGAAIKGLGAGSKLTAKVSFENAVTRDLPGTVAKDNLYVAGTYASALEGATVPMAAKPLNLTNTPGSAALSATTAGSVTLENLGTGTLTIWMQNGAVTHNDGDAAAKVADEAKDGSKSPKTGALL